jgi:hypothetical protein
MIGMRKRQSKNDVMAVGLRHKRPNRPGRPAKFRIMQFEMDIMIVCSGNVIECRVSVDQELERFHFEGVKVYHGCRD